MGDIDFVVTWVNGEDKQWQNKMQKYKRDEMTTGSLNTASRYRNFHLFKYWFWAGVGWRLVKRWHRGVWRVH